MSDPEPPPFSSLRAFAAAARRNSFRDAATELGVSPSAISHQVRKLERWLGAPLFERGVRQIRATRTGATLGAALNHAFADIDRALDQARAAAAPGALRIAALPLFTDVWLTPRLERFERAFPELSLAIDTESRVVDLQAGEADVAIRNVPAPSPGLKVRKLLDLQAIPLCSPAIAARLQRPADLAGETLIGLSVGRAGWPDWLDAAGVAALTPKRMLAFDNLPAALRAAADGRGVMLGLSPLIWDAPAAAGLVVPFAAPRQDAGAYFIASRAHDASPAMRAFIDWLVEEMRRDARRLRRLERDRLASC